MAKSVKSMLPTKVYKNTSILFDDYPIIDGREDKRNGHMVILLTRDFNDMLKFINYDELLYKYHRAFYTDKSFKMKLPTKDKQIHQRRLQTELMAKAKKSKKINETHSEPSAYKGKNVYYYLGSKLSGLYDHTRAFDGTLQKSKQETIITNYFKNNITNFSFYKAYDTIDIFIDIKDTDSKMEDLADMRGKQRYRDLNHFFISKLVEGYQELVKFFSPGDESKKINFYLFSDNDNDVVIYKIPSDPKQISMLKIREFYNIMVDNSNKEVLDEKDIESDTTPHKLDDKHDPATISILTDKVGIDATKDYINGKANITVNKIAEKVDIEVDKARKTTPANESKAKATREVVKAVKPKVKDIDKEIAKENSDVTILNKYNVRDLSKPQQLRLLTAIKQAENVELVRDNDELYNVMKEDFGDGTIKPKKVHSTYDDSVSYDTLRQFDDAAYFTRYFDLLKGTLLSFSRSDKSVPLFLQSMEMVDSSDALTMKSDLKAKFIDKNLKSHTLRVAIPEIIESNRLFIGGNWKLMMKQILLEPLVKTDANEVQVISNQNKCFLSRSGDSTSVIIDMIKHYLTHPEKYPSVKGLNLKLGKSVRENSKYFLHIDYNSLGKMFYKFRTKEYTVIFNQTEIRDRVVDKTTKIDLTNKTVVAINNSTGEPVIADGDGIITHEGAKYKIDEFLLEIVLGSNKARYDELSTIKPTRKLSYTVLTILSRKIPLIVVMGYLYGLGNVLDRAKIKYTLEDKKTQPKSLKELSQYRWVRFKDTYLKYEADTTSTELLLSGLDTFNTKDYNFTDLDNPDEYLDIFTIFGKGSSRITKGILGFKEVFFDNITVKRLERFDQPDNLLDLFLMGNELLEDTNYTSFASLKNKRIRPAIENICVALYKAISEEYLKYVRLSFTKEIPKSISVPYTAVLRHLGENPLVETYDKVNPIKELEARSVVSFKGPGGLNVAEGYSKEKRTYDDSMVGVMSIIGSQGTIGINRVLSTNPPILNADGELGEVDKDTLKSGNILSPAEAVTPFATNDDGKRRVFTQNQLVQVITNNKHVKEAPISTGYDATIPHLLGEDYIKRAKMNGVVTDVNETEKLVTVEYKHGSKKMSDVISYRDEIIKHGGAGIHLPNNLTCKVKKGDKFKKGDVIVANDTFFFGEKDDTKFTVGTLGKIVMTSAARTNDDGTNIRRGFGQNELAAKLVDKQYIRLSAYASIDHIVKEGDFVKSGSPQVVFQNVFGDTSGEAARSLAAVKKDIGDDDNEDYYLKNMPSSPYSGTVKKIEIFYTVPPEEMGDDMKKLVTKYIKKVEARNKLIAKNSTGMTHPDLEYIGVTEPRDGMIHGQYVDVGDILIEISTEFDDLYKVGDKMSMHSAIKSVTGVTTADEFMPYSEYHPDEPIDIEANYSDLENRLAKGPALALYVNKLLVELKRQVADIAGKSAIKGATRKKIEKLIIDVMASLERGGYNANRYKTIFKALNDSQFNKYIKDRVNDKYRYFQLVISSYDDKGFPSFADIKKTAKMMNVPLDEYVWYRHMKLKDKNGKPLYVRSQTKMPVGYTLVRTPVQRVIKKSKQSMDTSVRDSLTGQQTKKTKGARMSFIDMATATALGQENIIREVTMVRSDNMDGKMQGETQVRETGTLKLKDIETDYRNSVALRTADIYLLSGFVKSNLINDGYKMDIDVKDSYDKGRTTSSNLKSEDELKAERETKKRVSSARQV